LEQPMGEGGDDSLFRGRCGFVRAILSRHFWSARYKLVD
jgi:hypothetical protein